MRKDADVGKSAGNGCAGVAVAVAAAGVAATAGAAGAAGPSKSSLELPVEPSFRDSKETERFLKPAHQRLFWACASSESRGSSSHLAFSASRFGSATAFASDLGGPDLLNIRRVGTVVSANVVWAANVGGTGCGPSGAAGGGGSNTDPAPTPDADDGSPTSGGGAVAADATAADGNAGACDGCSNACSLLTCSSFTVSVRAASVFKGTACSADDLSCMCWSSAASYSAVAS